jgi:hypothetical protein
MMTKSWVLAFVAAHIIEASTGCSVYLAQKGHPGPNLRGFGIGTTEQEVESQLGTPSLVEPLGAGKRRTVYQVELTKESNRSRSLVHLVLDCATYGIWELPATIYELHTEHRKGEAEFVYGPDDRILEIPDSQAIKAQP